MENSPRNLMIEELNTWHHFLKSRLGYTFIPEHHIGVLHKEGRFSGFMEEGYHRLNNRNRLTGQIRIGMHSLTVEGEIRSCEGHLFQPKVNVVFLFDPRKAAVGLHSALAEVALKPKGMEQVKGIVKRKVVEGLSQSAGTYPTSTLLNGKALSELTRQLRHHLLHSLSNFGFNFSQSDAVVIESITAPTILEQNAQENYKRQFILNQLEQLPNELRLPYLLICLTEQPSDPILASLFYDLRQQFGATYQASIPAPVFNHNGRTANGHTHKATHIQS